MARRTNNNQRQQHRGPLSSMNNNNTRRQRCTKDRHCQPLLMATPFRTITKQDHDDRQGPLIINQRHCCGKDCLCGEACISQWRALHRGLCQPRMQQSQQPMCHGGPLSIQQSRTIFDGASTAPRTIVNNTEEGGWHRTSHCRQKRGERRTIVDRKRA
jgi:hypothetical protein